MNLKGPKAALLVNLATVVMLLLLGSLAPVSSGGEDAAPSKRSRDDSDTNDGSGQAPATDYQLPRALDFKEYVIKFNKAYGTMEWMAKANIFLARVINIFRHNANFVQKKCDYFLGLNEYTDISATDYEAMGIKGDPALVAVDEAKLYPAEMPASELPSVQQLTGGEGFSMSAADDDELSVAAYKARYGDRNRVRVKQTLVDFSEDSATEKVNLKDFYRELKKSVEPELAEQLTKVIDPTNRLDESASRTDKLLRTSDPKSERAMIRQNIKYRPVVESNNANYDGSHVMSQGIYDNTRAGRAFSDRMAAFLDYDVDIMDDLKPYEPPSKKTKSTGSDDSDDNSKGSSSSYLSSFFSVAKDLAKSVASTLIIDSIFDQDELEDEINEAIDEKARQQQRGNKPPIAKKIKYSVDWRVTGCITRPKSQNSCNACYAFTVVALMEYYHCRQTRELTEFSAQYIVDCGKRLKLNGCKGGYLGLVGKFINSHGLELQAMYPYSGLDGACPYEPGEQTKMGYLRPKILNWVYVKKMSDWYEHIRKGPLLVGIAMPSDFLAYAGGIHDGSDCNVDKVHAMLLVGSGSQDGAQFWLFKNSFSSDWGENGYFRLAKEAPLKCFNSGVVVRVDFKQGQGSKNPEHKRPVIASNI